MEWQTNFKYNKISKSKQKEGSAGIRFIWVFKLFARAKCNTNPQKWEIE